MVDEIDLHLHPEWQRVVVPTVAKAFPALQFFFSTHSPIVAGTVTRHNVYVMEADERGHSSIEQYKDRLHGLDADQVLLSPYFGLETTRDEETEDELRDLADKAM